MTAAAGRPTHGFDPRYLVAFLITLVLAVAELRFRVLGGYQKLLVPLLACVATEAALSWYLRGRIVNLLSAYISGISLSLLTKPQGGVLWPFALGGILAISSKYVLQYRGQHLWNPTNFAISLLLLAAPNRVSVLSHQFGNELSANLVIWIFGVIIASRVRVLHITLAYVASFAILGAARATLLHGPILLELAPITGPMYQLFVFFMITDPRTIVSTRRGQVLVVVVVAIVESVIRILADHQLPIPTAFSAAPAILSLAIVGPVAKWIDVRRTVGARRVPAPASAATAA